MLAFHDDMAWYLDVRWPGWDDGYDHCRYSFKGTSHRPGVPRSTYYATHRMIVDTLSPQRNKYFKVTPCHVCTAIGIYLTSTMSNSSISSARGGLSKLVPEVNPYWRNAWIAR